MTALGPEIVIRHVRAGDEHAIRQLLSGLDPQSRYLRWFTGGVDVGRAVDWAAHPERVAAVGLLALADGEAVGHAVLIPAGAGRGEIAFEVAAPWRCHGIATTFLERLLDAGAALGLDELYADVLCENTDMLAVLRGHGEHHDTREGSVVTITLPVPGAATPVAA